MRRSNPNPEDYWARRASSRTRPRLAPRTAFRKVEALAVRFLALVVFVAILQAGAAHAQVTLDNKVTAVKQLSWSHTVNGSNLVLVVGVAINAGSGTYIKTLTWGSTSLSCLFAVDGGSSTKTCGATSGSGHRAEIWGAALGTLSSTANTVTITLNSGSSSIVVAGSASFTGASQSTPFGTAQGHGGLDSSASLTFSGLSSSAAVVDTLSISTDQQPSTLGSGQTSLWSGETASSGGTYGQGSYMSGTNNGGAISQSWGNGTTHDGYVAVPINPATTSGPARKGQTIVGQLLPLNVGNLWW